MSDSAWVSTSSVYNTFLMPVSEHSVSVMRVSAKAIGCGSRRNGRIRSFDPHAFESIPAGHVGDDHIRARRETAQHFDGVDRGAAQADIHSKHYRAVLDQLEQSHRASRLAVRRTADVEDVVEPLLLNRSID